MEVTASTFALGYALLTSAFLGVELFGSSDFVKTGFPRIALSIGGYDSYHFLGVAAAVVCIPLATSVLTTAAWKSRSLKGNAILMHLPVFVLYIGLASVMFDTWKARNIVSCGFFLCAFYGPTSKKDDTANGYYQCKLSASTVQGLSN
jgi:hypothetical protein